MTNLKAYSYNEKEQKEILKSIIILCDTNEQENKHITEYYDSKKIPWKKKNFSYGDYSFKIPANISLGIGRDIYFDNDIMVERKNSLRELSSNIGAERERFEKEWSRANNCKKILLVENGSYKDIFEGRYNTEMKVNSYVGSMFTFIHRYNIDVQFCSNNYSGRYLYSLFYYFLREKL